MNIVLRSNHAMPIAPAIRRAAQRRVRLRSERGGVMLVVIMIMMMVVIIGLAMMAIGHKELNNSIAYVSHVRSQLQAQAAVERAIAVLRSDTNAFDSLREPWRTNASALRANDEKYGTSEVLNGAAAPRRTSGIEDEEAKLHLNLAPAAMLAALPGMNPARAAAIVAERRLRPFATPDDLLRTAAITPKLYFGAEGGNGAPGLRPYVTVWGSGKINVNTASHVVLSTIPGLTTAQVSRIMNRRAAALGGPFRDAASLLNFLQLPLEARQQVGSVITVRSTAFHLIAVGRTANARHGADVRIAVVIDRATSPVRIRYWQQMRRPHAQRIIPRASERASE